MIIAFLDLRFFRLPDALHNTDMKTGCLTTQHLSGDPWDAVILV